jgi:hypothetical protein
MIKPRLIKSGNTVSIDRGCFIWTMDYTISPDESEIVEIQRKTTDWAFELTELFGRANTKAILASDTRPEDQVPQRIQCQQAVQKTGPTATGRGSLDLQITGSHDPDHPCSLYSWGPHVEKNAASDKNRPCQFHRHHLCQSPTSTPGLSTRPQSQVR